MRSHGCERDAEPDHSLSGDRTTPRTTETNAATGHKANEIGLAISILPEYDLVDSNPAKKIQCCENGFVTVLSALATKTNARGGKAMFSFLSRSVSRCYFATLFRQSHDFTMHTSILNHATFNRTACSLLRVTKTKPYSEYSRGGALPGQLASRLLRGV